VNKLVKIIDTLEEKDLEKLKMDIDTGNMKRLIERRLIFVSDDNKVCPICDKPITTQDFVLEFGKIGLRMKASFDALDCLNAFLKKLQKEGESSVS